MQKRSCYIRTILDDLKPVVFTQGVSCRFIVGFGNEHSLFVERHVEVTNNNFMLQTNFVQSLLVDLIAEINLTLHKE